jgi:RimJ/RimL family protein N-acetyltransferase
MDLSALTRELPADEREHLLTHLMALEPEARRMRFANAISDEGLRQYVEEIDFSRDAVFTVSDENLAVVGAAHLSRADEHAELGLSVLSPARGRGIGAALLERSTARARNWGVHVLFMNCLVENEAVMRLARRQGLQVAVSSGDAEGFVRLPGATLVSVAAEAVAEGLGLIDHGHKARWLALRALWLKSK